MRRTTAAALLVLCLPAVPLPAAGFETAAPPVAVVTLGPVQPTNAPGQSLYLVRYEIAPGTKLPLHHHEGTQIGLVAEGELTYHVATGEVPVYRNGADAKAVLDRTVRAGETGLIRAGEWVVEEPGDRHWGANRGDVPLVIFTSALLREGAPLATRDPP
jgi:quercetin dioxygenase-like cupin family protein